MPLQGQLRSQFFLNISINFQWLQHAPMLAQTTIYVPQQTPAHVEEVQLVLVMIIVTDLAVVRVNMK